MPGPNNLPVDVPLSTFLGLNTEVAPPDLPEGVSPDNADVAFVPGNVFSRPAMQKLFGQPFTGSPSMTYTRSYLQPNQDPLNLYLTSDGLLAYEDVLNNPGHTQFIAQLVPGSYASSATAFGREYIAVSDGQHGTAVPLQFDGTFLDRVSQDGPGAAPAVADVNLNAAITQITINVVQASVSGTESGPVVTITCSAPHGLTVGTQILIYAMSPSGYNGIWTVQTVPTALTLTYVCTNLSLGSGTGGNLALAIAQATMAAPVTMSVNDQVVVTGAVGGGSTNPYDNDQYANPSTWPVYSVISPTIFNFSIVGMTTAIAQLASNAVTSGGILTGGGQSSSGLHQCVQFFITRQGYITAPSPPVFFNSNGSTKWLVSKLLIGPSNVVARGVAFTGSGGDNFFTITTSLTFPNPVAQGSGPIVVKALIVPDNTSTTATFDISDNQLFGGQGIDIPGNNLFALLTLGPVLGFYGYASRLLAWGEYNKVQNLENMTFDGGFVSGSPTLPTVWNLSANSGGAMAVGGAWTAGFCWQITGDGTLNPGNQLGQISQAAYQDIDGISITQPNTNYIIRMWANKSQVSTQGEIRAQISSTIGNFVVFAKIRLGTVTTVGGFVQAQFDAPTPAVIPSDTIITFFTQGTAAGQVVTLDEMQLVFVEQPYFPLMRGSYVNNPESFDGVTGTIGPADDPNPIRGPFEIRNTLYILTAKRLHSTSDNSGEPGTWQVPQVGNNCGAISWFGITSHREESGEEWASWASDTGARAFGGGDPGKVSQEIQTVWEQINPKASQLVWVVNDTVERRLYFGVPLGTATAPNQILVMDYRELDTAQEIKANGSIHISFTGKMIASDLARKWAPWHVNANCGAILLRPTGPEFCVGGGNGVTPGLMPSFGNVYSFNPLKFTDDDYGQMSPYYTLYGFINHEMEQQIGCGSHRKLYKSISLFVTGVGYVIVTPLADTLTNPWTPSLPYPLSGNGAAGDTGWGVGGYGLGGFGGVPGSGVSGTTDDLYIGMNVSTERCFFKIQVVPISGQTDVQFNLQKFVATLVQHPWSPVGSGAGI
jgi:hypothetical protein